MPGDDKNDRLNSGSDSGSNSAAPKAATKYIPPHLRKAQAEQEEREREQRERQDRAPPSRDGGRDFGGSRGGDREPPRDFGWSKGGRDDAPRDRAPWPDRKDDRGFGGSSGGFGGSSGGGRRGDDSGRWPDRRDEGSRGGFGGSSGGARRGNGNSREEAEIEKLFDESTNTGINFDNYFDIPVEVSGDNAPAPITDFSLPELDPLRQAIEKLGYSRPTPVQQHAIPIVIDKRDTRSWMLSTP